MNSVSESINWDEVGYFYKSPDSLVDYSMMQSFSLIKSAVEVFAYYGINDFTADDMKAFFERLQLIHKRRGLPFVPSAKKISGVLECCENGGVNSLSFNGQRFHIDSWDSSGYGYEIEAAKRNGLI